MIRGRWTLWKLEEYKMHTILFCFHIEADRDTIKEMAEIHPLSIIILDAFNWDFRKYVVRQDLYDDMMDFIASELKKDDLKLDTGEIDDKNGPEDLSSN